MLIDIAYLLIIVMAVIRGLRRGLIVGLFSMVAIIIGLAAALKLSVVAAGYLSNSTNISAKWIPVFSFILVFVVVMLLVRLAANMMKKAVEFAFLGPLDRLGGVILFLILDTVIFSILLFYAVQTNIISQATIDGSRTYSWIQPFGPYVIDGLGRYVPFFKDLFHQLEEFFGNIAKKVPPA
jgi:membrane protein required for colicin V production